jgi:transmembrane 9 superfamily protein 1
VLCRSTTGLYIFAYSVFYWVYRSNMSGSLQTANYFGYTFLLCYIVFMMLGTVGFFSSLKFVKYIYSNVKTD